MIMRELDSNKIYFTLVKLWLEQHGQKLNELTLQDEFGNITVLDEKGNVKEKTVFSQS